MCQLCVADAAAAAERAAQAHPNGLPHAGAAQPAQPVSGSQKRARAPPIILSSDDEGDSDAFHDSGIEFVKRKARKVEPVDLANDDDDDDEQPGRIVADYSSDESDLRLEWPDEGLDRGPPRPGPAPKEEKPVVAVPAAAASPATSPFEDAVQAVLGILPDLSVTHLKSALLRQPAYGPANIEAVLEDFFNTEGGYPKQENDAAQGSGNGKGKGRAVDGSDVGADVPRGIIGKTVDEDDEIVRAGLAWFDTAKRAAKPPSATYREAAVDRLAREYNRIRLPDIRSYYNASNLLYAPTFVALRDLDFLPSDQLPIKHLASARSKGKGKLKEDDELTREAEWIRTELWKYEHIQRRRKEIEKDLEKEVASGAFFECGCCFGDTAISQMITCSEGCQFCRDCARGNADNEIGLRKYVLRCMSTDGCTATFPESELVKCLSSKTLAALHKIKQEKEVDEAEIEGLVKCPFCPFAMIIENPDERLFRCQRDDCRIVSCRDCKKKDHLPKTCAEVTDDEVKLKSVHRVEEAMSEALIRRCPKVGCGEPYIKEAGTCNKVRCSNCATLSCYICNKIIQGYQHFKNPGSNLPAGTTVDANATCALWDDTDQRNFQEIEAARVAAEAEARRVNAELELKDEDFAKLKMAKPGPAHPNVAHLPPPRVPGFFERARQQQQPVAGGPKVGAARAEKRARLNPAHPPAVKLPKAADAQPKPAPNGADARLAALDAIRPALARHRAARQDARAGLPAVVKPKAVRVLDAAKPRDLDGEAGDDATPGHADAELRRSQAAMALYAAQRARLDQARAEQRLAEHERYQTALARVKERQAALDRARAERKQAEDRRRAANARAEGRQAELDCIRARQQRLAELERYRAEVKRYQAALARAEAREAELDRVQAEQAQKERASKAAYAQLDESAARTLANYRAIDDAARVAEKARRRQERQRRADVMRQAQMAKQKAEKYATPAIPRLPAHIQAAVAAAETPVRAGPSRLTGSPSPRPPIDLVEAARLREMRERGEPDVSRQRMAERNAIREAKRARLSGGRT